MPTGDLRGAAPGLQPVVFHIVRPRRVRCADQIPTKMFAAELVRRADPTSASRRLTGRAVVGGSTGGDDTDDGGRAGLAGQALAAVDAEATLERAARAVGGSIVGQRAALRSDRAAQYGLDRPQEVTGDHVVDLIAGGEGVDSGGVERLVAVDVAQSCDDALIHEQGFDLATAREDFKEGARFERQRFRAEQRQRSIAVLASPIEQPHAAESTGIAEAELLVETDPFDGHVGVRLDRRG